MIRDGVNGECSRQISTGNLVLEGEGEAKAFTVPKIIILLNNI